MRIFTSSFSSDLGSVDDQSIVWCWDIKKANEQLAGVAVVKELESDLGKC